jgi:hypothetical protein
VTGGLSSERYSGMNPCSRRVSPRT